MDKDFDFTRAHDMFYKMIQVSRAHRCVFESMHSALGIHHSQHRMLMFISKQDKNPSQKDIAKHFDISAAAVAVSIRKLEEAGYVTRQSLESDSRFNSIIITEKGKEIANLSRQYFADADKAMFENFSEEDYKNFEKCLDMMIKGIKDYEISLDNKN